MRINLTTLPVRWMPDKENLKILNTRAWVCSYSGGKDSTALVTWIEWLRRVGMVKTRTPRLVQSNTGVEYPFLEENSQNMMAALTKHGWECTIVKPLIHERLYCRIFGIGNVPIHPGCRDRMRWCTRSTKIDPMLRYSKGLGEDTIQLSGVRYGESAIRDGKLKKPQGCSAGGECGMPQLRDDVRGPIIDWQTCKVFDWIGGKLEDAVREAIPDLLPIMKRLLDIYEVKESQPTFFGVPPATSQMRFGCIGCPAISNEKITKSRQGRENPKWIHLRRLYILWDRAYNHDNRCNRYNKKKGKWGSGPLRMSVRQELFAEFLQIEKDSGVKLINDEEEAFIRDCWTKNIYPRGWSSEDENNIEPNLFSNQR